MENLVSEKSFGFVKFGLKKVSVLEKLVPGSVSENLVSEKSLGFGFGEFGLKKKSWFRFPRIWSRKKVSVSENLVSKKKSWFSENLISEKKKAK